MADDDNFDIDIYGDDTSPEYQDATIQGEVKQDDASAMHTDSQAEEPTDTPVAPKVEDAVTANNQEGSSGGATANGTTQHEGIQQISSTGGSSNDQLQPPKQAPRQQGMKRKQGDDDDRPMDPGATAALMINDLNWWVSEEDIRGWANQSGCEDELIDITFNEHKVNGKSKGQVYIHLQSPQAATALKHQLENLYKDQAHAKKPTAVFNPPHINPFKTLPKDVPAREKNRGDRSSSGNFGGNQGGSGGGGGGNFNQFNNRRGNFNSRGNQNSMGFQNRNFSGPAGGNMGGGMGGYGGPGPMNNFGGGPMGGMNNFGGSGGFNRGGMMGGMRGGMNTRGGRGGNMGMNNMGGGMNMPMGGNMMGMGGGMMGMGGNMGMMGGMGGPGGFGGNQPHFNPAFFNQNQGGGDGNWNPHGAKRPRPE